MSWKILPTTFVVNDSISYFTKTYVSLKSVLQRLYPFSGTSRWKSLSDVVADLEFLCKLSFSNGKTGPFKL